MHRHSRLVLLKSVLIPLSLAAAATPALGHVILDAPNGGETMGAGCVFTITWHITIAHNLQNWDLWCSTAGPNGPWFVIVMNLPPGSGAVGSVHTYDWTVLDKLLPQVWVRVRMDNSGTDYYDVSNAPFSIVTSPIGDVNCDGAVDVFDFAFLHECFTGPDGGPPSEECLAADLDGDGDVDFHDVGALQIAFSD